MSDWQAEEMEVEVEMEMRVEVEVEVEVERGGKSTTTGQDLEAEREILNS